MASPHPASKQSVNLASAGSATPHKPRPSRIRRDPPAPVAAKKELDLDPEEHDQRVVIVGVLAFALAVFIITLAIGTYSSWSPREYTMQM